MIKIKRKNKLLITIIVIILCLMIMLNTVFFILPTLQRSTNVNFSDYEAVRNFYLEENDTLDGLYVGSSGVYRFWMPPLAYQKTGMAVYALACNSMPISAMEDVIRDAVTRQQKIKFVAIELRNISKGESGIKTKHMKILSDAMPRSKERTHAIDSFLNYCEKIGAHVDPTPEDYYFPILRNRGAWIKSVNTSDVIHYLRNDLNKTYKGCQPYVRYTSVDPFTVHKDTTELNDIQLSTLNSLFDYCNELESQGISVLFTLSPCDIGGDRGEYLRAVSKLVKDNGFTMLDFTQSPLINEIDFDYSKDFYDNRHASYTGGVKYTEYMTEYFDSRFDLPDHRGDPDYDSWDESVRQLEQRVKNDREKFSIDE